MTHGGSLKVPSSARASFTLSELLVAVTIIGMLAAMAMGVYVSVRESARVARTRATIAKIHRLLMERYEGYLVRPIPMTTRGLPPEEAARRRLNAIRDLIRMEMPQSFSEIRTGPLMFAAGTQWYSVPDPAVRRAYFRKISGASPDNQSAECLFLILTTGPDSARDQFAGYEIADTDEDALPEFIDGWGRPIRFLRWAPGLVDSDLQPRVVDDSGNFVADLAVEAVKTNYDPFDPRKVDYSLATDPSVPNYPPRSWRLVPFVYSAGPDGEYGLYDIEYVYQNMGDNAPELTWRGSPFFFFDGQQLVVNLLGKSIDSGYTDNLHNHRLESR
jgi:hypothetical protein